MRVPAVLTAIVCLTFVATAHAQKNELALEASGSINVSANNPALGGGFQVNYGRRLVGVPGIALYGEVPFVAGFNNTGVNIAQRLREGFDAFYLTPGLRLKFVPGFPISPYLAAGAGWGHFSANNTNTSDDRFVADWDGGLDIKLVPIVGLRLEARDFYSSVPSLIPLLPATGNQHNVIVSGGVVFRF